jgi:hypothetical protein
MEGSGMPSLRAVDTALDLGSATKARRRAGIVALWALLFAVLIGPAPSAAQKARGGSSKVERRAERRAQKGAAAKAGTATSGTAKGAKAPAARPAARVVPATPKVTPAQPAARTSPSPAAVATTWKRAVEALSTAYALRNPERALEAGRDPAGSIVLGNTGTAAARSWRSALTSALGTFESLPEAPERDGAEALRRRLLDWIQLELVLLDAQAEPGTAPASGLGRAARLLRAVRDADGLEPEPRQRALAGVALALPSMLRDASLAIVSVSTDELELALEEIEDLGALLAGPRPATPRGTSGNAAPPDPLQALETFRAWLLELGPTPGADSARLGAEGWARCVRWATGTEWDLGRLEARALRDLARLDLADPAPRERGRKPDGRDLADQVARAAEQAARVGIGAHILRDSTESVRLEFRAAESPRTGGRELTLRAGADETWIGTLALPHPSWSPAREADRRAALRLENAAALGVRHGLAGEAYALVLARAERDVPPMLLDDRLVREGLGLYALEWVQRIAHEANPFRASAGVTRAFAHQRGREAARLLAALELHAKGVDAGEAALSFRRRTGVDEDTAAAEVRAALRDPLHGIGYLGLLELLALEERLDGLAEPRRRARTVLLLLAKNPGLRPSDFSLDSVRRASAEENPGEPLEIPGPAQQEQPRSR